MTPTTSPAPRARRSTRNVTAVLGPTNTGKTHLAIERMLGHESGLIGLPLRLLAREVYGRVSARVGADKVALITGEEKIVPTNPRYWVSTVEAMPTDLDVAFLAIDEVQIAADLERGHVFTDRILNLRGSQETLLLGAATMRGIIEKLLPGVHIVTRPRMSVLAYSGQKKISRLPERSAIVTFSADDVYAVGELIRRQRGGAAVVLGALSPRTRNKQVEIYQAGDVDFIVATDAIGMGLNLDVDHVAFAGNHKFDGYQHRPLTAAELGQVAGRAGRHMRDGTFGVTGRVDPFPDPLVEALETHRFEPVKVLQWRTGNLDFSSLDALRASLETPAGETGLTKAPPAADQSALETLSDDPEVRDRIAGPDDIRTLWNLCRMPDYRKIAPAQHAQLVGKLFGFLIDHGAIPDDWIASEIQRANRTDGDIDTLSHRVSQVRTWTFVANQPNWVADPAAWCEKTRQVEDALSDALHDRLTQRFVDRRTSVLMRRLKENTMLEAEITASGEVLVEGQHVGTLKALRFTPDPQTDGAEAKTVRNAALKALASAIADRAEQLARAKDEDIVLSADAHLRWKGEIVGRLAAGQETLQPRVIVLADEQLTGPERDNVDRRLTTWVTAHIATILKPLVDLSADAALDGTARGLAFRLVENLGILDRRDVLEDVRGLDQDNRAGLRRHGVRFGAYHIFIPALLKPAPSALLALLWAMQEGDLDMKGLAEVPVISASGRTSVDIDADFNPQVYRRFGYRIFGRRAVRIDILERLADLIRPALSWRAPVVAKADTEPASKSAPDELAPSEPTPAEPAPKESAPDTASTSEPATDSPTPADAVAPDPATQPDQTAGEAELQTDAPASQTAAPPKPIGKQPAAPPRPDGAIDAGRGFTVTQAMTSLLGASGEDFSVILKGLGYRVERKRLPEPATADDGSAIVDEKSDVAPPRPDQPKPAQTDPATTKPTTEPKSDQKTDPKTELTSAEPAGTEVSETPAGAAISDQADPEPAFLEIWRPARQGRPHGDRNKQRTGQRSRQQASEKDDTGSGSQKRHTRGGGKPRHQGKPARKDGGKGFGGSGRGGGTKPAQKRPARIDPDNPFAALAALKKDLEKAGK